MTALNKQALREAANAANIASWGKWESYKPHKGARGYEVKVGAKAVAQHCLKVDSAFIAAANPPTVLALLDELESAEKRIAELEARKFKVEMPESFYPDGDTEVPLVLQEHEVISAIVAAGGIPIAICRRCKSELDLSHRPDGAHYCHGVKGE